jgi:hypothetical protein
MQFIVFAAIRRAARNKSATQPSEFKTAEQDVFSLAHCGEYTRVNAWTVWQNCLSTLIPMSPTILRIRSHTYLTLNRRAHSELQPDFSFIPRVD